MEFDVKKTVSYWLEGAEYDFGVADAMFQTGKYPYALFIGHLALEKLLKALVVKNTRSHAPITHSLPFLAEKTRLLITEPILIKLREFMEFHFEARYPRQEMIFYTKCTKDYTTEKLNEIKEVYKWLKEQL
ncbi:MAG TPA: HEPN domain-containing protein [Candidatus Brocadiia bacterium]|nr:HEPN domain-containing protein [Planctomycetota bacterium]MDO8092561.1 HEPN domain-containing protein [Candidatus Brocadiales bacterium]